MRCGRFACYSDAAKWVASKQPGMLGASSILSTGTGELSERLCVLHDQKEDEAPQGDFRDLQMKHRVQGHGKTNGHGKMEIREQGNKGELVPGMRKASRLGLRCGESRQWQSCHIRMAIMEGDGRIVAGLVGGEDRKARDARDARDARGVMTCQRARDHAFNGILPMQLGTANGTKAISPRVDDRVFGPSPIIQRNPHPHGFMDAGKGIPS